MQKDDYRATFIITLGMVAAMLSGFWRQAAVAHQLGAGQTADIFLVAFALPEFIFIALPIIVWPILIPIFTECRERDGEIGLWQFALQAAFVLLGLLVLIALIVGFGTPLFVSWLAPGFSPQELSQAARAAYLMLPAIGLMGISTLVGALLQIHRRFARSVLTTTAYNLAFVATLLSAPIASLVDRAAWGVTFGAAAALLLQMPLLWRHRPALWPKGISTRLEIKSQKLNEAARLIAPLAIGYAVHHTIIFIDRAMATALGSGSAAILNYSYHLALMIGQISGLAVSTALFPGLAAQLNQGDLVGARCSLGDALQFVWLIALPAGLSVIVLETPLIQLLLEHGAFDKAATLATKEPLIWYTLAVIADAICQPLWRVVYAQRSGWAVVAINALQTVLRLLANLVLLPVFGYTGLALSAFIGLSVQVFVLGWFVRCQLGGFISPVWRRNANSVGLAAAASAVVMVALAYGPLVKTSALTQLALAGIPGGLVYVAGLWLLGVFKRTRPVVLPTQVARLGKISS